MRRHSAPDVTARKRNELTELANRWHKARAFYVGRLSQVSDLADVLARPRHLRERQRKEGWAPVDLTVHYHQTAFLDAATEIRRRWESALGQLRFRAGRRSDISDDEKRWIRAVTRAPLLLQACLEGREVEIAERWADDLDQVRLGRRLRRILLRMRPTPMPARRRNWFLVDTKLYRPYLRDSDRHFRGAWISITGLQRTKPIRIPLMGKTLEHLQPRPGRKERPDLRIEVLDRIVLHTVQRVPVEDRDRTRNGGIDKGHDTLLTLSFGEPTDARSYGAGAGDVASDTSISSEDAIRRRRALAAYERSIRNSAPAKARRMRRRNLGVVRRSRSSRRVRSTLRDGVNRALNELFRDNPDLARLHVESLHFVGRRRGHAFNRRLRRWLKGFLQRRLAYKAELNGVELNVVNAAFTSQTCPLCWFTSSENRREDRFKCGSCGFTGSSDAVAATNVLRRGSDPAITRFMRTGAVKQILEERWRSARTGRAWGSNGAVLGADVSEDHIAAGAANNCSMQSTGTGLEPVTSCMSSKCSNQLS